MYYYLNKFVVYNYYNYTYANVLNYTLFHSIYNFNYNDCP